MPAPIVSPTPLTLQRDESVCEGVGLTQGVTGRNSRCGKAKLTPETRSEKQGAGDLEDEWDWLSPGTVEHCRDGKTNGAIGSIEIGLIGGAPIGGETGGAGSRMDRQRA